MFPAVHTLICVTVQRTLSTCNSNTKNVTFAPRNTAEPMRMFGWQQEEEMQGLQKRIQQLEGDLDQAQTQLEEATQKLENTEKQLSNVSSCTIAVRTAI